MYSTIQYYYFTSTHSSKKSLGLKAKNILILKQKSKKVAFDEQLLDFQIEDILE